MLGKVNTYSVNLTSMVLGGSVSNDGIKLFDILITNMDRGEINEILFNWNESELNEEGNEILIFVDSRSYGPKTGGADIVDKKDFIEWLKSDGPFDPEVYGEDIKEDIEWSNLIKKARSIIESEELKGR